MAQKKFIIDGGFQTNADSVLTGNLDLTGNINMTGNIIPTVDSDGVTGYDLGSPTAKWRDLYLSSGSLYIDGQKVVESNAGTIVVQADADQSLTTKVSGTGTLTLQSATTINMAGTLQMANGYNITDAGGVSVKFGDDIEMNGNEIVNLGAPSAPNSAATKAYTDSKVSTEISTALASFTQNAIQENDSNVTINDAGTGNVVFTVDGATRMTVAASGVEVDALEIGGVTAATTAYADQAEADAIATANAYTDTRETAITTAYVAADTALDTSLKAYADTAEADAKTYADGIVAAEASARAAADTALDTSLKAYADTAEADAKTYADGIVAAEATARTTGDTNTLASANSYTDGREVAITTAYQTYADQAEADAKAYADGLAATEHAHHVDGDAATLTSANDYTDAREAAITTAYRAYADQSEADAETAAATYTDSKVATEASARIAADDAIDGRLTTVEGAYVAKTSAQALHATDALRLNANVLSLHKGDNTSESVDLSLYLDDSNLARILSGTVDGNTGIATFQRDDTSTFTVDMSAFLDNTNLSRITSASWNTTNGVLTLTRNDSSTVTVDLDGRFLQSGANAVSASKLATARTIALSGDVSGSVAFDGSANVTISAVVADDSHNHVIANVDGLQAALDSKSATSHNHTLDSLSNTTITSNTAGEILKWNGTQWVNNTLAEAGIQPAGNYQPAGTYNTIIGIDTDYSLSGATVISGLTLTDGVIQGVATRNLTPANIGAQPAGNYLSNVVEDTTPQLGGDLDTNGKVITNTQGPVTAKGNFEIQNTGGVARLAFDSSIGDLYGPFTLWGNAYPQNTGTSGQVLTTNGSGTLSWTSNVPTASTLQTARTIALAGDVTGSASFNGSANVTITATVANDSHSHSNYITSNANDTATGIYTFSNTTNATGAGTGAVRLSGGMSVTGNVYVGGDVTAYSDERLKDNIEVIADAGAKVAQLRGVTFTRKDDGGESTGLIAQDVQKVLPEATGVDADGYIAVKYGNMVGLLVEAIKELQAEVAALKAGK